MSSQDYLYARRMALEKFMGTYEKEYKNLKKTTHKCQYECYSKDELSRNLAEDCARACLKPFMMQRKVNNDLISKCEVNFQRDEQECRKSATRFIERECQNEAVVRYDECLQKEAPKVKKCVAEYIKVFDNIVLNKAVDGQE